VRQNYESHAAVMRHNSQDLKERGQCTTGSTQGNDSEVLWRRSCSVHRGLL